MKDTPDNGDRVREIVKRLPKGEVVTYGDISRAVYGAASKGQAVASAIAAGARKEPESFPWWRVVNKMRQPTPARKDARQRLEEEKVEFLVDGTVDPRFHNPGPPVLTTISEAS